MAVSWFVKRRILIRAVTIASSVLVSGPAFGQFSRDPLTNSVMRQAAGMPSLGDQLVQLANDLGAFVAAKAQASAQIDAARERFWRARASGMGVAAAHAEFEALLRQKDYTYLSLSIGYGPTDNPLFHQLIGAEIDGGIPDAAQKEFHGWVGTIKRGLSLNVSSAPTMDQSLNFIMTMMRIRAGCGRSSRRRSRSTRRTRHDDSSMSSGGRA